MSTRRQPVKRFYSNGEIKELVGEIERFLNVELVAHGLPYDEARKQWTSKGNCTLPWEGKENDGDPLRGCIASFVGYGDEKLQARLAGAISLLEGALRAWAQHKQRPTRPNIPYGFRLEQLKEKVLEVMEFKGWTAFDGVGRVVTGSKAETGSNAQN